MAEVNRTSGLFAFSTTNAIAVPAVASGNSLLIVVWTLDTMTITGVTDNGGGSPTYTLDVEEVQLESATGQRATIYRRNNITTGPTEVTITTEASIVGAYDIIEYDNLADAPPAESFVTTRAFVAASSPSVTTESANQIGIAVSNVNVNRTHTTASTGWAGGATDDATAARARIFANDDLGAAGAAGITVDLASATWHVVGLWTYATTGAAAQEATGDGDLAASLGFALAGTGSVQVIGVVSDTLKEPNEQDTNVADASNVTVRIWHGATITGAPDQVLTDQVIAGGALTFRAAVALDGAVSYQARWTAGAEDRYFEVVNATAIDLNA